MEKTCMNCKTIGCDHKDARRCASSCRSLWTPESKDTNLEMCGKIKMKLNEHAIVARAVEEGIAYGVMRAFKHTDTPNQEQIKEAVENAVMAALTEVAWFENGVEE